MFTVYVKYIVNNEETVRLMKMGRNGYRIQLPEKNAELWYKLKSIKGEQSWINLLEKMYDRYTQEWV